MKNYALDTILIFVLSAIFAICTPGKLVAQEREMSRKDVLNALENGVVALRTIDRPEQAQQLLKTLREYAQLGNERTKKNRQSSEQRNLVPQRYRELSEEQIAEKTISVMRYAMESLIEAGKGRPAELMELAIHARELRLKRAQGQEAAEIMKRAPSRANETELLLYASKLLKEQRKPDKEVLVKEMGEWFQATMKRNREREQRRRNEASAHRSSEREKESNLEGSKRERETSREKGNENREREELSTQALLQQIERHQEAIQNLARQLERLAKSNEELHMKLNRSFERRERNDR